MPDDAESPIVPKKENSRENSSFSGDSVVDVDAEGELDGLVEGQSPPPVVPQKRKGGRKPVRKSIAPRQSRSPCTDICHVGGEEAEKPASPSSFS